MAGIGALVGDALVLGAGYGALQLFAHEAIEPTAGNFRRAAFVMTGAGLVVPPLLAVLGARLANGQGQSFWRGLLLATAGNALALAVGYWASPQLWAFVPAQLAAVGAGTSLGLHWGSRRRDLGRRGGDAPDVAPAGPPLAWSSAGCPVAG